MKTTIQIQNLKCGGCANTILNSISKLKNVQDIDITVESSKVSFNYETTDDLNTVKNTLSKIGYPVIGEENSITKKAKSYISCAIGRVTK